MITVKIYSLISVFAVNPFILSYSSIENIILTKLFAPTCFSINFKSSCASCFTSLLKSVSLMIRTDASLAIFIFWSIFYYYMLCFIILRDVTLNEGVLVYLRVPYTYYSNSGINMFYFECSNNFNASSYANSKSCVF